jgi:putative ABC transport system permease protein
MSWLDAFALAAKSVGRRAGRAVLTVLAVGLGATLLVALLTIAGTARTRVLSELSKGGPLAGIKVAAAEPDPTQIDEDNAKPGAPKDLDEQALNQIRALPGVGSVVPVVTARIVVVPTSLPPGVGPLSKTDVPGGFAETVVGANLNRISALPLSVLAGRLPDAGASTEVAVTPGWLQQLGLGRKDAAAVVGQTMVLGSPRGRGRGLQGRWTKATVVGVVAQEAASGELVMDQEAVTAARAWSQAGGQAGRFSQPTSPYAGLFVVARRLDQVTQVRQEITQVGYSTQAPENLIASVQRYLRVVEIVLTGIGAIALVIASLGIANAMLAAVRERRREIGVLKAIGASDGDVLRLFLVEAAVLGLVGGALGTLAGWAIASGVGSVVNTYLTDQGLAGVRLSLPGWVALGGVLGSMVLALLAGTAPAVRAARLPAREAVGAA